jgi:hypothetical protein
VKNLVALLSGTAGALVVVAIAVRRPWKAISLLLAVLVVGNGLGWAGWALSRQDVHGFHWGAFCAGLGALITAAGVIGGALGALVYGRKADVSVSGLVHAAGSGELVLEVRPCIHAVGYRGLRVAGGDWASASLQVTEVWLVDGRLDDGFRWDVEEVFGDQTVVAGGETLTTTVLVELGPLASREVIGWRVAFLGTARRTLGIGGWAWEDKAFVPVPARLESTGEEATRAAI